MNNVEKTLYDLLKSGMDADTLTKALNDAQKLVDADKEAEKKAAQEKEAKESMITAKRERLACAMVDYLRVLGLIDKNEDFNENKKLFAEKLKENEDVLSELTPFFLYMY